MTVFDKKLNIWIIDDLANRRDSHEKVILDSSAEANIVKAAHPLHLKALLEINRNGLKDSYNIFFSDYNMKWMNVEWTSDLSNIDGLKADSNYDNFPGTQKILDLYKDSIDSFLLVMLSTIVLEDNSSNTGNFNHLQTENEAWTYDNLYLKETGTHSIHKMAKPFDSNKLDQALRHYKYLIKH